MKKYIVNEIGELINFIGKNKLNVKIPFRIPLPTKEFLVYVECDNATHNTLSQNFKCID